jgi:hypothetical protein
MRGRRAVVALALALLAPGAVWAQGGAARPSEQDIFGAPPQPAAPTAPADKPAPAQPAPPPLAPGSSEPPAAAAESPGQAPPSPPPPSLGSDAAGTARDQDVLGAAGDEPKHLSDYQAPDNPLQIGGQLYLRAQTSALQGQTPDQWRLSAPSLVDAFFDARPNPRVRAFILGRMSYDPTAPPGSMVTANSMDMMGALTGTSVTGFSTFSTQRGPTTILDQMWIRFDILERVFVTVGKQHVRWGTGRFWQPTDYLHPVKRNPLDVFDARPGASMLKLHVPWEERGWNFYGFGIFEDPNNASSQLNQVAAGARAEIVLGGAEIGIDGLVKRGQNPRLGIDISTGIWDFDVYADVAIRWAEDFNTVRQVAPPAGVMCTNPDGTTTVVDDLSQQYQVVPLGTGITTQAVGGINWSRKYNDNDLFTIGAEYFYNQPGYSDPSLYPGLLFNNLHTPMLNFFYTGKHYASLFVSLPAPYSWNYTTFTLSTLANLSDWSAVTRLDYSLTLLTHLTLQAFAGVHYGTREGEFRLGFDIAAQTVLRPDGTCQIIDPISQQPAILDLGVALRVKI